MNLVEMLQAAGVDGHKADFYLASLELGEATVATIAQKAGIGRTNAYEVLDRLLATGLVATVQKGARSYVIPQDPIALLRRVECQRQVVQDVLPQLRALHNSSGGNLKFASLSVSKVSRLSSTKWSSPELKSFVQSCRIANCSECRVTRPSRALLPSASSPGSRFGLFAAARLTIVTSGVVRSENAGR